MRIIAYINWVFFLFIFLFFAYRGIEGLDKSFDNNYFREQYQKNHPTFADNTKVLGKLPRDAQNPIVAHRFPFHLFTHVIVGESRSHSKFDSVYLSLIDDKELIIDQLDSIDLLLNINVDALNIQEALFVEEAYKILDSLHAHFPNANKGLVFEVDASKTKGWIDSTIATLNTKVIAQQAIGNSAARENYKHYLCYQYATPDSFEKIKDIQGNLPNYSGRIIKTFHLKHNEPGAIGDTSLFDKLDALLQEASTIPKSDPFLKNTIFCFPTYPIISFNEEDSTKTRALASIPSSTLEFIKEDSNKVKKINTNRDSSIIYYKYVEKNGSLFAAYEDKESFISKLEYAIAKKINIGFWSVIHPIYSPTPPPQKENPIMGLFKFAKGNLLKKIQKKPATLKDILILSFAPFRSAEQVETKSDEEWTNPSRWMWPELDKRTKREKTPDYLLFLFVPLFVLKIFLPLFILYRHKYRHSWTGDRFLKPLRVNLFNSSISAYALLWIEVVFWTILLFLFLFHRFDAEDEIGWTFRNFSILVLLIAVLGRPIVKFIIKLVKLVGKAPSAMIKKMIKLLPHLGEIVYYSFAEDEKDKSKEYIKKKDRNQHVYVKSKNSQYDDLTKEEKEQIRKRKEWMRAQDFFIFRLYRELTDIEDDQASSGAGDDGEEHGGKGHIDLYKGSIISFQLLFIFLCFCMLSIGLMCHSSLSESWSNESFGFNIIFFIFLLEIGIITAYFKQYYVDYILKLFARNV